MSKDIVWYATISTPPMGKAVRKRTGYLLRLVQDGEKLSMPESRPMPNIGKGCHELRVRDKDEYWRTVYLIAKAEIVVLEVFKKKTHKTPQPIVASCKERIKTYRAIK